MNTSIISLPAFKRSFAVVAILALMLGTVSPAFAVDAAPVVPVSCTIELVSDVAHNEVEETGNSAAIVIPTPITEQYWLTDIDGAEWIWATDVVTQEDVDTDTMYTFINEFEWTGTLPEVELLISADNSYTAYLNGKEIGAGSGTHGSVTGNTHTGFQDELVSGVPNILKIEATNLGGTDPISNNPAGLMYKLTINGIETNVEGCDELPPVVVDTDDDGVADEVDNCVNDINSDQVDTDDDQVGDTCDETPNGNDGGNNEEAPSCEGPNLLSNGSFEEPAISGDWGNVAEALTNWLSSTGVIEIWKNFNGSGADVAAHDDQNVELDGAVSTTITQGISTVVGNEYKVSFAFSARDEVNDNEVEVFANGLSLGTVAENGIGNDGNEWSDHYFTFVATTTNTNIAFQDLSTSDGLGTLLDNASVCLTEDNFVPTYLVNGYAWNDKDQDDIWDVEVENPEDVENALAGWTIKITKGETSFSTTTDSNGYYFFQVPEGTWIISEEMEEEWEVTFPNDGTHEVTVPEVSASIEENENIFASIMGFIIPTAHAQGARFGFNFGNVFVGGNNGGGNGGGGNGRNISLRDNDGNDSSDEDEDDEPEGEVLGEATSTMPVGAPNTGAGGASASLSLHGMVAILASRKGVQVSNEK